MLYFASKKSNRSGIIGLGVHYGSVTEVVICPYPNYVTVPCEHFKDVFEAVEYSIADGVCVTLLERRIKADNKLDSGTIFELL